MTVWTVDLDDLVASHGDMIQDIDDALARGHRNFAAYGEQTLSILQGLEGAHWAEFSTRVRDAISQIVETASTPIDESTVHLRIWASRLSRADISDERFRMNSIHNHSPAFLSGVYYVRLPECLSEDAGGTFFINPFMHPLLSPQPGLSVSPSVGRLVLFPSILMHAAALSGGEAMSPSRIVLGLDAHFVPT